MDSLAAIISFLFDQRRKALPTQPRKYSMKDLITTNWRGGNAQKAPFSLPNPAKCAIIAETAEPIHSEERIEHHG